MIRPPPRSTRTDTLFPYTTLFRSQEDMALRVGAGARYIGNTVSTGPTTVLKTPGYSLVDALVALDWNRWTAAINATNLFDKSYFRSEEHTSELQSLMRISYAVFCLHK